MKRLVPLAPRARSELREAVSYLADRNPQAAKAISVAIDIALTRIAANPDSGTVRPALAPPRYRFFAVAGFPYLLVYEVSPVRVARFVHMARDLPRLLADLPD
jgi:toxin ParE1/3/4